MSTANSILSDMLVGLRLDGHSNYDQWHCKIKYLLSENDSIYFITKEAKPLSWKDATEIKWYDDDVKKDRSA